MILPEYAPVTPQVAEELASLVGKGNLALQRDKCEAYSYDEVERHFWHRDYCAEAVIFPETTEEVASVMRYANAHRIPVTPRGAGTGLSGGAVPACGGIVLSLEKMNRILEVDPHNLTLTAEPGVITAEINRAAGKEGLFYAGDPCSGDVSYIGGNVAENAGGNKVLKYGTTGANLLGLEVVLPDGSVTWFGGKRRKDVTGLDLLHLMAGSEGILGIVTKVIVKLLPKPACTVDLLVPFETPRKAMDFVPYIMTEARIIPSSLEFMERSALKMAERFLGSSLPYGDAGAHLIIQLEGNDPELLADQYERVGDLCIEHGALEVFVADNRNTREKLWKARKCISEAVMAFYSRYTKEDVSVPPRAIPDLLEEVHKLAEKYGFEPVIFGHAGDGNLHVNFLVPPENPSWEEA
ncbi:MAG TPA: FAD-binding oxidoreductase, partial [Synergistaceae bacterium]|nr:FAD-binding oxidoreductase [Synergistaceae bacterium]